MVTRASDGLDLGRTQESITNRELRSHFPTSLLTLLHHPRIPITLTERQRLSGLSITPLRARALYVVAHGPGVDMEDPLCVPSPRGWRAGVALLRYEFAYRECGTKHPDEPHVAHAAVRGLPSLDSRFMPPDGLLRSWVQVFC